MTKPNQNRTLSNNEKGVLIVSIIIMVGTLPLTYVFFLIPLLGLPIAVLAGLVLAGFIKNAIAVRVVQVLAVLGATLSIWLMAVLLNWQTQ